VRETHALKNGRSAIDMHEIYERATIRKHGSYMPHGAIFKTSRDILKVGDIWRFCTSALELQNAETKRVAKSGGSCRQQMSAAGGDPPKWPQRHCSRGRHCDTWVCNHAIHLHAAQALGCPDAAPRRRGHCPAGEPPEGAAAQRVGRTKLPLEMGQGGGAEP